MVSRSGLDVLSVDGAGRHGAATATSQSFGGPGTNGSDGSASNLSSAGTFQPAPLSPVAGSVVTPSAVMEETPRERSEASSTGGDSAAKGSDGAEWRGPPRAVGVEDESATDAGRSELPHSGGAAPAVDAKGASPAARGTADVEISFADDGAASGLSAKSGDHPASGSRRSIKTSLQGTTRQRNKALEQGEREFGNVEAETWMRTCSSYAVLAVVVAVALVGIAGTSATVLLVNQSDARDLELAKSDGEGSAKLLAVTVERSLRRQVADLYLMASTLQVQPNGVIDRWTHQTDRFYDVFEGVSISAAIRYLPGDMRDQWESAMSEYAGRTVTMQNATGGPAEPRDFYYVMQHVTPPTPLLDYKEISIFQDQVAVVNAAMASNRVQVSAPTPLLTGALGYLAYVKVNGTDDGSSTWGALVYSCPIADLLEGALGDSRGPVHPNAAELSVSVTDITTSNHHLVFQNVAAGSDAFTLGSYRIQYAQRLLSLEVWTTTEFVQARLSSASSAVLVAGIVVTVLLAVFAVITACLVDFLSRRAASRAVAAAELAHTRVLSYVLHEMRNPVSTSQLEQSLTPLTPPFSLALLASYTPCRDFFPRQQSSSRCRRTVLVNHSRRTCSRRSLKRTICRLCSTMCLTSVHSGQATSPSLRG